MKFDNISVSDGLSNNWVRSITKDNKGFIWIGTWNGLNRYDGRDFIVYKNIYGDSCSLRTNKVNCIYELSNGEIWVGSVGGYISVYDRAQDAFRWLVPPGNNEGETNINATSILETRKGDILIGTKGSGLDLYDPVTHKFKRYLHDQRDRHSISSNQINDIVEDTNGKIWVATDKGLNLCQNPSFLHFIVDPDNPNANQIKDLYIDYRDRLWLGTAAGLYVLESGSNQIKMATHLFEGLPDIIQNHVVWQVKGNQKGILYIGCDGGFFTYDLESGINHHYLPDIDDDKSVHSKSFYSIYYDNTEILWIGTFNAGVDYYSPYAHSFEVIPAGRGKLNTPHVTDVIQINRNELWICTDGGGVNVYNESTNSFKYHIHDKKDPGTISSNIVVCIEQDRDDRIWLGTYNRGLNVYLPKRRTFKRYVHHPDDPNSLADDVIRDITVDHKDNLIVLNKKMIQRYNGKKDIWEPFLTNYEIPFDFGLHDIEIDKKGNIWLGGYLGFIYIDIQKGKMTKFVHNINGPIEENFNVLTFLEDHHGNMWIGLDEGGLKCIHGQDLNIEQYSTLNGLPDNTVTNIFQDNLNHLWITSQKGITELVNIVEFPDSVISKTYETDMGNIGYDYTNNCLFKSIDGEVFVGSNFGLSIFHPEKIKDNPYKPPVVFTSFRLFNEEVDHTQENVPINKVITETKGLQLTSKQNVVTFQFVALNYIFPEKNQYAYRLEGFEPGSNQWNYIGTRNEINYTNLKPGKYTLRVIAANNDGVWNREGTSLSINVLPPYWKTWWFRMIVILSIPAVVILWIYNRTRNLSQKKKELEKLVDERTMKINQQNQILEKQTEDLKNINNTLKKQQEEIIHQKNNIEFMAKKLQEATANKLRFFTNISHEFRTPLTLILGPLEQLLKLENNSERKNYLIIIQRNAQRLFNLINQLIDIRKLDQNKMDLTLCKGDIVEFCRSVVSLFSNLANQNNIELIFKSEPDQLSMWFDSDKIEKILYNLISNAFKFTGKNGKIIIELNSIDGKEIKSSLNHSIVQISVKDNGIGIEQEKINKLFDRFYHVEKKQQSNYAGTGIGLSYAKELAELHKGKIEVYSSEGEGSVFKILLPLTPEVYGKDCFDRNINHHELSFIKNAIDTEFRIVQQDEKDEINIEENQKEVLLIIDDHKDLRDFLKKELGKDYVIIESPNGHIGLKKTRQYLPDLVICDVMMPVLNGIEYAKKVRSDMLTSHIPVLLLTAKTGEENKIIGFETGADEYITKPFNIETLKSRIKNIIETRKRLRENYTKSFHNDNTNYNFSGNSLDHKFIKKAIYIIEENLANAEFGNKEFAMEMMMGKSHLYTKLKALTNQTVHEFIRSVRLKKACKFLQEKEYTVSEIAYLTGFNSPVYFSKCFKEEYGLSPTDYQKQENERD